MVEQSSLVYGINIDTVYGINSRRVSHLSIHLDYYGLAGDGLNLKIYRIVRGSGDLGKAHRISARCRIVAEVCRTCGGKIRFKCCR